MDIVQENVSFLTVENVQKSIPEFLLEAYLEPSQDCGQK